MIKMELILNDFSVVGQFQSCDAFTDYVIDKLGPVLDSVIEKQVPFFSKQDVYACRITESKSLNDILQSTGDPAIYKIRSYIISLGYHPPYWDDKPMSRKDVNYEYFIDEEEPNCFTEVIERRGALLSFPGSGYDDSGYECKRDGEEVFIHNVRNVADFLQVLLLDDMKNIRYVLENYPFRIKVSLAAVEGKCYAEEALLGNELDFNDMQNILLAIPRMVDGLIKGQKNDYWDSLRDGIFEFRMHVSGNRIFRLLFFQKKGIIFLNGFIKKRQTTPSDEIDRALQVKASMRRL